MRNNRPDLKNTHRPGRPRPAWERGARLTCYSASFTRTFMSWDGRVAQKKGGGGGWASSNSDLTRPTFPCSNPTTFFWRQRVEADQHKQKRGGFYGRKWERFRFRSSNAKNLSKPLKTRKSGFPLAQRGLEWPPRVVCAGCCGYYSAVRGQT